MNIPQSLHDEADWPLWPSVLLVLFLYSVSEFAQNTVCHSSYSQYKYSTVVEGKWPKSSAVTGQKKASHNKSCIFKVLATVIHMTTRWLMSIRIRRIQVGYIFPHPFMYLGQTVNSDFILKALKIQRDFFCILSKYIGMLEYSYVFDVRSPPPLMTFFDEWRPPFLVFFCLSLQKWCIITAAFMRLSVHRSWCDSMVTNTFP